MTAIRVVDRVGELGARPDYRFDELTVGIFVAAVDQFAERLHPVGALIVHALEVERAKRMMVGPDDEEGGEPSGELFLDVAERCRFERRQVLPGTPSQVGPPGTELVGFGSRWGWGDQDDLLRPGVGRFFDQPAE